VKNIYLIRPFGFNIGNHVIYAGLKQLVMDVFNEPINIISLPATNKYNSLGKSGLTADSIYEINQYGDGVIVGGGNVLENGEIQIDESALRALRPPLMVTGVAWGNIYDRFRRLVPRTDSLPDSKTISLLERSSIVLARDAPTKEHLDSLGAKSVSVGGCPSLFLKQPDRHQNLQGTTLLSIRHPALMSISPYHQSRVRHDIRKLHHFLTSRDTKLQLLCHDHRDISFASSFPECEYLYTEDSSDFLSMISAADALITFRLHSFLPAIVFGTHAINLSYDQRAAAALDCLGLGQWDIDYLNDSTPLETALQRHADRPSLKKLLSETSTTREALKSKQIGAMALFVEMVRNYSSGRV
jgi:hypothetical protein